MAARKSWFRIVVAVVACLALLGASVAAAPEALAKGPKVKSKHQVWARFGFGDVDAGRYGWAVEGLASMKAKGIVKGYDDGTFRPQASITQPEALAMALRLLGLEEEAQKKAHLQARAPGVPAWARGYVNLASELGLIHESELNATSPASRLWVAVLLVKALDLEAHVDDVEEELEDLFEDAGDVPGAWRGYLVVAAKKGLLSGYPDRTFRPNQPITRAEMAAILDRIDQNMPWIWEYEVRGRVVSVGDDEITVAPWWGWLPKPIIELPLRIPERVRTRLAVRHQARTNLGGSAGGFEWGFPGGAEASLGIGGNQWIPISEIIEPRQPVQPKTYQVSEDALILVNGQEGSLDDISPGDDVRMVLNSEGAAILIIANSGMWWDISGAVTDIDDDPKEITVRTSVCGENAYRAADNVRVEYQGKEVEWSDIRVGDQVSLRLYQGKVIHVKILPRTVVVHGTVRELPTDDNPKIQVALDSGTKVTYAVDDKTEVRYRGKDIEIADLKVGDKVKLVVERGTATLIELKTPVDGRKVGEEDGEDEEEEPEEGQEDEDEEEARDVTATITAVYRTASRMVITVRTTEGKTKRYELASDCRIELEDGSIYVGEIRPGDRVTLTLEGNVVTKLVLRSR